MTHILAIDPGKTSGVAHFVNGNLDRHGEVDSASRDMDGWVKDALIWAVTDKQPLIMVGETWGRGGMRGMAQWQGLGAAWKAWEWSLQREWKELRAQGFTQPAPKTLRVHTSTWRSKIYGGRIGKDQAKQMAVFTANSRFGLELDKSQHNEAEAVLIGYWATKAKAVADKIPRRFR